MLAFSSLEILKILVMKVTQLTCRLFRIVFSILAALLLYSGLMFAFDRIATQLNPESTVRLCLEWGLAAAGPLGFGLVLIVLAAILVYLLSNRLFRQLGC